MMIPGLSGFEGNVRRYIKGELAELGIKSRTDMLGNLIATIEGDADLPSVMLIAHMDQLGLIVRKIEASGLIRAERVGGVPERALAAQEVLLSVGHGRTVAGIIANKSHHATTPDEKYRVVPYQELYIDCGFSSAEEAVKAGITVGTPIVYAPNVVELAGGRIGGTSVDDRAACAIMLELARAAKDVLPTVHLVFSVLEEFNLRGAQVAAQVLKPDIAMQIDLMLATDTPDMADRGEMVLGGGPGMSLYSFHGRGTLNGVIPHPALVHLLEQAARSAGLALQRSAQIGGLTDLSYVQLVGEGVAAIDIGFPMRHSHTAMECCDLADLGGLVSLILAAMQLIPAGMKLERG